MILKKGYIIQGCSLFNIFLSHAGILWVSEVLDEYPKICYNMTGGDSMGYKVNDMMFAFGITLFAGLSTGIGSILAFYTKETNKKFLSAALGFSAGVMIYVSMIEIFSEARESLEGLYGANLGYIYTTIAFFVGIAIIALI